MRLSPEGFTFQLLRPGILRVGLTIGALALFVPAEAPLPEAFRTHEETVENNLEEGLARALKGEFADECSNGMPAEGFNSNRLLRYHNYIREQVGVTPLTIVPDLQQSAQRTAEYLARQDKADLDHPNGSNAGLMLAEKLAPAGWLVLGENISTSEEEENMAEVMQCWIESEGHYENVVRPEFNSVGFGYAMAHDGKEYAAVHFGGIKD